MTEDKRQEVLDRLKTAMQGKACPMCGGQERTLIDRFGRQDINEIGAPFHNSLHKIVATTLTDEVLDSYDIHNSFEIYKGTHTSAVSDRFQNHVMPFFSKNLCADKACR